jgi:arsenite-transporting ATPase
LQAATSANATDFVFVGGKGGVGKTTCAAGLALERARQRRVLVASVDPAPSLGDSLRARLGPTPARIPLENGRLWAVEIDATRALDRWLAGRRDALERLAVDGTFLDHDDVSRLLRLSLPGIDELAALLEISRLAGDRRYDLVVVDTAPTGHALRMLAMPETLADIAAVFDRLRGKTRAMQVALTGAWRPAAEDALVSELAATAADLAALLRDPERTRVAWVTVAEPMAMAESRDAVESLRASGIPVATIIVNRLTPAPPSPCGHCEARQALERLTLRQLPDAGEVVHVAARATEPRGVRALSGIAADMRRPPARRVPLRRARPWSARLAGPAIAPVDLLAGSVRLAMLGGKGGVGKTTCAAALAIDAAVRRPRARVLLISTDPAHSVADAVGAAVTDDARPAAGGPPNLDVRELDPQRTLRQIREAYAEAVDRAFDRLSGGSAFDAAQDRSIMRGLIDLAPPGLDELAAVLEITNAIADDPPPWDLVVMDTAPTGHALRLLEMPALIQDWARALMAILLKYEGVVRIGDFAELLLRISKGIGRLRALLVDHDQAVFIAVTRAAALPRLETARLLARLDRLGILVPAVVVNAVGRGTCSRCARAARTERAEVARMSRLAGGRVVVTGALLPPPHGVAGLRRWGRAAWRDAAGYHQGR